MDLTKDPFLIFPELVWEVILDNIEDLRDIQNVFAAFPKLGECKRLQRKKAYWLFDQAVLYLATWDDSLSLRWDDLISLRQTCKRWSLGVDKILQEDLNLDNYIDEDKPRQTVCYWEGNDHRSVSWSRFQECLCFDSLQFIDVFMEKMESHLETGRNPFLTRTVIIEFSRRCPIGRLDDLEEEVKERLLEFDKRVGELLEGFGHHIWYFQFRMDFDRQSEYRHRNNQRDIYTLLVRCLRNLPNLRSLEVFGTDTTTLGIIGRSDCEELLRKNLPDLPHLKTFRFDCKGAGVLLERLQEKYSAQILRTNVTVEFRYYSDDLYKNLKELELTPNHARFHQDYVHSYKFQPLLTRLQLKAGNRSYDMDRILAIVKKIPLIKSLDIEDCLLGSIAETEDFSIAVPTLRFLKVRDSYKLNYNFLLCFPSLRRLVIVADVKPLVVDNSVNKVVKIREQISTGRMYDSNVWELFGELKGICMVVEVREEGGEDNDVNFYYQFRRETYERLKTAGRGALLCNGDAHPIRKDIVEFLKLNAGQGAI